MGEWCGAVVSAGTGSCQKHAQYTQPTRCSCRAQEESHAERPTVKAELAIDVERSAVRYTGGGREEEDAGDSQRS